MRLTAQGGPPSPRFGSSKHIEDGNGTGYGSRGLWKIDRGVMKDARGVVKDDHGVVKDRSGAAKDYSGAAEGGCGVLFVGDG